MRTVTRGSSRLFFAIGPTILRAASELEPERLSTAAQKAKIGLETSNQFRSAGLIQGVIDFETYTRPSSTSWMAGIRSVSTSALVT